MQFVFRRALYMITTMVFSIAYILFWLLVAGTLSRYFIQYFNSSLYVEDGVSFLRPVVYLLLLCACVFSIFAIFPWLQNERNRNAQDIAFLICGIFTLSIFAVVLQFGNAFVERRWEELRRSVERAEATLESYRDVLCISRDINQKNPYCRVISNYIEDSKENFLFPSNTGANNSSIIGLPYYIDSIRDEFSNARKKFSEITENLPRARGRRGGSLPHPDESSLQSEIRKNSDLRTTIERMTALEILYHEIIWETSDRQAKSLNSWFGTRSTYEQLVGDREARYFQSVFLPILLCIAFCFRAARMSLGGAPGIGPKSG
jgi:hypothetical protein